MHVLFYVVLQNVPWSSIQDATNKSVIELAEERGLTWLVEEFRLRGMIICESSTNEDWVRADPLWDKQQVVSKSYNHSHKRITVLHKSLCFNTGLRANTADVMSV